MGVARDTAQWVGQQRADRTGINATYRVAFTDLTQRHTFSAPPRNPWSRPLVFRPSLRSA